MIRTLFSGSVFVHLALAVAQAQPQAGKASTPQDRAKAVEIARSLETDPLGKQAKDQGKWLTQWLIVVPDISVKAACSSLVGPILGSKKNYGNELYMQTMFSSAAFII